MKFWKFWSGWGMPVCRMGKSSSASILLPYLPFQSSRSSRIAALANGATTSPLARVPILHLSDPVDDEPRDLRPLVACRALDLERPLADALDVVVAPRLHALLGVRVLVGHVELELGRRGLRGHALLAEGVRAEDDRRLPAVLEDAYAGERRVRGRLEEHADLALGLLAGVLDERQPGRAVAVVHTGDLVERRVVRDDPPRLHDPERLPVDLVDDAPLAGALAACDRHRQAHDRVVVGRPHVGERAQAGLRDRPVHRPLPAVDAVELALPGAE